MIGSVLNNSAQFAGARGAVIPKSNATFGTALQTASSTAADTVAISNAAIAKSASNQDFEFDFSYTNLNHTQTEYQAHYAEGARRISEMQGLPAGQYDFTRMSPKMAQVVLSDMVMNHGVPIGKQTIGLENFISGGVTFSGQKPVYSDAPQNVIENIKTQQVSFPDVKGGSAGVPKQSLEWILSITRSVGTGNSDSLVYSAPNAKKNF